MARKKTQVDSIRHTNDKRTNIPTEELRDFVADDERTPKTMLYPRDPSLDPQLVWKGKDEQDRQDLAVPVVPIYIQEKIHPQALIEDFRRGSAFQAATPHPAGGEPDHGQDARATQLSLFADFNGLDDDFEKKVDFYSHRDDRQPHWSNRMILGDSLLVMTSLAEKEGLKGKVQTIYFDPPYGIKFRSNWQVSTRKRDVKDGKAEDATRQPEQIRAFRDTWKLGVHSYLAYIRDRLAVARDLLTETGSIFVQIGDENVHLVRCVLDEIFGPDNFITQITFSKTSSSTREYLGGTSDFLLFYAKSREHMKYRQPYFEKSVESEAGGPYSLIELPDGTRRRMTAEERNDPSTLPKLSHVYRIDNLQSQSIGRDKGEGASCWFPVEHAGKQWLPNARSRWKTNERGMAALKLAERLESTGSGLYYVRYIDDFPAIPIADNWTDTVVAGFASDKKYVVETSTKVIERCILMTTDPGDIVLDPTCGSGTTAYVAEQWGRRWITVDTSRVALALARTRLMAARFPYYLLADSPEGRAKERSLGFQPKDPSMVDFREQAAGGRGLEAQAAEEGARPRGSGGLGVQAVKSGADPSHGRDPRSPEGQVAPWEFIRDQVRVRQGAFLPHWTLDGATYAVTFRLADSLPRVKLEAFLRERDEIVQRAAAAGRELSRAERDRLRELHSEKVEVFLDSGHGACVLRDDRVAGLVRDALGHFDGQRYDLSAWCVMPNHVHVIVRPRPGHELPAILHSWKSFTANAINKVLGRKGELWQQESFDHLIRDADDFDRSVRYVLQNPSHAGLENWPWRGTAFQAVAPVAADTEHGLEARATTDREDVRKGFVYKRVPHVTLKSIANNPDIKEGMTREAIDRAIARHADTETLFDQPYEDTKRLRVTGPFTVESLSPHRVLSTDEEQPASEAEATRASSADFATMIIENLRKAGVQNTVKNERLTFETLEPFPGAWIHAAGTYVEADGSPRRVAVSLGPEHGTIGPEQVKEAAKEAVQGIGYDLLILCGFAFDPHVSEEAKRYGKLAILPARMNPDLAMGDELLKKTGAGNLFMVFGEPDLELRKGKDGTLTVEVRGVDVYDPTTGQIRNSSTDDIACWFLDTNYDGESFFVRHAYFTGADEPYEKLQRALRAEIDEAAWSSLYSTTSRPFPRPASGKIAVKVINHYGDEVLKVLGV